MSVFETVMRTLLQEFKAHVLANTVSATHSDLLEIAELPVLVLYLPDIARTRLDDANVPVQIKDEASGTVRIYSPSSTYDLSFDFEIIAENTMEVLEIGEDLTTLLESTPYLAAGDKEYPIAITAPIGRPGTTGVANLRRATGTFLVEGVEVETGQFQDGKLVKQIEVEYENQITGGIDRMIKPQE